MPDITLWGHPLSFNARKVHWALEELELPYELRIVDLFRGEQRSPDFLRLNPLGRVPVLRDGDRLLRESNAIVLYLAETYGIGRLQPTRRVEAQQWMQLLACHFNAATMQPWRMKHISPHVGEPHSDEALAALLEAATPWVAFLDSELKTRPWLAGEQFDAVDLCFAVHAELLVQCGFTLPPHVAAWFARSTDRPAFRKTAAR